MKIFLFIPTFLLLIFCSREKSVSLNQKIVPEKCSTEISYSDFKKSIKSKLPSPNTQRRNYLFSLVSNDIFCYWNGTPWAFYGTTRQPKTGHIACGYFVTNTMSDLGFEIERVKLAKVASGEMIKKLCVNIKSFRNFASLEKYLATQPDNSVFIIGLDYHTGYIVKDSIPYFLHSNYIGNIGVVKEPIEKSNALKSNKFFMIGSVSDNDRLLDVWSKH
ncbi:hypothetical protein [Flavobacterium silvaticum]|uniref:Uncharacterized protein n=1 Tax=Flavobacterium silvaticum TaxID=1852020 RepID=A0A972JKB9_9FLAO|nr:hypothetical protein [Flavobacterium silvaticum]NMH28977.1 hypothetical protein [Flavobacterium silvaticum]